MELPKFTYHPNPLATGAIVASDSACPCCGRKTGYAYGGPVYSENDVEHLCPWCIASGDAAKKFDADFSDAAPLGIAGVPKQVIDEVTTRTPGFTSWQQEVWLACCGDACEFHGDLSREELLAFDEETMRRIEEEGSMDQGFLQDIRKNYQPVGDPALYKFVCRHCREVHVGWDCS